MKFPAPEPDRKAERPKSHLATYSGILHVDGYAGFEQLTAGRKITRRAKDPDVDGGHVFSREALAIEVGQRLRDEHVVETLNRLVRQRGASKYLFADNGAEFTGRLVDLWAYHYGVRIDFSRPGKPTDNAYIEIFNGSFRDECLNVHWFASLPEARRLIEAWRQDYNASRPHMGLGNFSPAECLAGSGFCRASGPGKSETNAGPGPPFPGASPE
ncbi:MAG: transposase [Sphingosinicella sp.]|nr:transposase [Sphingosinicella sp.]